MNTKLVFRGLLAAVSAVIVLSGCPNPITDQTFLQMADHKPPMVDIAFPVAGTAYTQTVTVQGTAIDGEGRLKGIAWTVTGALGLLEEGTIPASGIGPDGDFSFPFSTLSFSGPIAVTVKATDWNDNVGTTVVTMAAPGASLSSFSAVAGNKKVTLDWDIVPDATYTVYWTTNGTLPSEGYGSYADGAAPGYEVTGLANGSPCTFLLRAHTVAQDYWSGFVSAIPLSVMTLAPSVRGGYRKIDLEWGSIPATNSFVVYRATAPDGPYVNYTGVVAGTTFTDGNVTDGVWYYYKVSPALDGSVTSTYNGAETFPLPPAVGDRITRLATGAPAKKVLLNGSYVYVALGSSGLRVVNVAQPRSPFAVTTIATTDAQDLSLYGDTLVVADGSAGIRVFDVSVASAPVLLKTLGWAAGTKATAVAAAGFDTHAEAYVLLVDTVPNPDTTSIRVVDIGTPLIPSSIVQKQSYSNGAVVFADVEARGLDGRYTMVYVATGSEGLLYEHYFDSDSPYPWNAWRSYDYPIDGYQDYLPTRIVMGNDGLLYVLALTNVMIELPYYKMLVMNTYLGGTGAFTLRGETGSINGDVADITVSGATVYAANGWGLQLFAVADTTAPQATDYWNTPGSTFGVAASGTWAFVASGDLGLQNVDAAGASSMAVANAASNPVINDVVVREGYAYTVSSTFRVMDITMPASPSIVGSTALTGGRSVALSGPWAFVADGSAGLTVVDISNPASPQKRASSSLTGSLEAVAVKGDYAYAAENGSLQIFDISDPDNPVALFTSYLDADAGMHDIVIRGRLAYVTDGAYFRPNNLRIIDVGTPTAPIQVGASPTPGASTIWGVSLQGVYALITDSMVGIGVYAMNIDPTSAEYLTRYGPCDVWPEPVPDPDPDNEQNNESARGIATSEGYAFVADNYGGFSAIDISDPSGLSDASLVSRISWGAFPAATPNRVRLSGRFAYVADGTVGLKIVQLLP